MKDKKIFTAFIVAFIFVASCMMPFLAGHQVFMEDRIIFKEGTKSSRS